MWRRKRDKKKATAFDLAPPLLLLPPPPQSRGGLKNKVRVTRGRIERRGGVYFCVFVFFFFIPAAYSSVVESEREVFVSDLWLRCCGGKLVKGSDATGCTIASNISEGLIPGQGDRQALLPETIV